MKMAGFALAIAVLTSCAGGGSIEVPASPSRSASQLPTPTVSLQTPTRSATRPEIPSPTPTKPSPALSSSRPAEEPTRNRPSRTDSDAIGDEESLAVTDPRGDHHDPDSHCSPESVDCHPVGDYQPIAECQPVAVGRLVRGGRACRNKRRFLVLVGAGGSIACSRDSDAPSRAGTRRQVWRADFATAEQEVAWFARVLVPELGQSGSLDQVEGGWTVGANRIAAVEDRLTVLEASAPDDVTRTGTRTLRDAVRASRGRVEELLQSGDPEAISPTLNEVAAELEAALGSVDQAG